MSRNALASTSALLSPGTLTLTAAFATGVCVGMALRSLLRRPGAPESAALKAPVANRPESPESEEDEEIPMYEGEDCKMVLIVRQDLKMGAGKAAAQCCHATLGAFQLACDEHPEMVAAWEEGGQAKITLKAPDEKTLMDLYQTARKAGLVAYVVRDAGRTQIPAGSKTVLAIGPAPISLVDSVAGHLKLY
eukprot:m.8562 g.8562  ORF g.8562 m.8562 type:complete len:191 (+) comp2302_c0_seq1:2-574(+)